MIKFILIALAFLALPFEVFVEGKRPKGQRFFSEKNGCVSFCTKKSGAKRNSYESGEKWVNSSSPLFWMKKMAFITQFLRYNIP